MKRPEVGEGVQVLNAWSPEVCMALATGPMDPALITVSTRTWGSAAQISRRNGSLNLHEKSV